MDEFWKDWCRLCSSDKECDVDLFTNKKPYHELRKMIETYFSISLNDPRIDKISTKICRNCNRFVKDVNNFVDHTKKVDLMFSELAQNIESLVEKQVTDTDIRQKYGIQNDYHFVKENKQFTDTNNFMIEKFFVGVDDNACKENMEIEIKSEPSIDMHDEAFKEDEDEQETNVDETIYTNIKAEVILTEVNETNTKKKEFLPIINTENKRRSTRNCKRNLKESEYESEYSNEKIEDDEDYVVPEKKSRRKTKSESESNTKNVSEHKEEEFQCEICNKKFRRKKHYRGHLQGVHKLYNDVFYECKTCGKRFTTEKGFKQHEEIHLQGKEKIFTCSSCPKTFPTKTRLKRHEETHLPSDKKTLHPCPHCDKKFVTSVGVNVHVVSNHTFEKSFICEECGKKFTTKGGLKEHSNMHLENAAFQCTKCSQKFKFATGLRRHMETHSDVIHICPHCGLKLKNKHTLQSHMITHSDTKRFKCEYCGMEFKRSKNLKNHMIQHTGLRLYLCQFCDKSFVYGSSLWYHKKTNHASELAKLRQAGEKTSPTKNIPKLEQLKATLSSVPSELNLELRRKKRQPEQ